MSFKSELEYRSINTRNALIIIILLSALFTPYFLLCYVNAQGEVFGYNTEGGETYYLYYYWPTEYYTYYYSPNKVPVTIGAEGFPSTYSTTLKVDDSSAGVIQGGGTVYVEVNWRVGHTFSVQSYVEGSRGERFYCPSNSWYLEKFSRPTREAKASNTFYYTTQYYLSVSSPHGDATKNTGWYAKGSSVSLSTPKTVDISQGEREVFDGWSVSGSTSKDANINIVLDSPVEAKAEYHKEYYLQVRSEYGSPSGSGWYKEGYIAPIQVERELPLDGLMGSLGGKRVFAGWSGEASSGNNVADVRMDSPKTVTANWREDYSTPYLIMTLVAIAIIVILVVLSRRGVIRAKERRREPEAAVSALDIIERRYAKGEITREEYLKMKKDLEK